MKGRAQPSLPNFPNRQLSICLRSQPARDLPAPALACDLGPQRLQRVARRGVAKSPQCVYTAIRLILSTRVLKLAGAGAKIVS
jgi:hypothetical protein